ncbi:MAG: hypothetical protein ACOYOK_03155 [Pseudobdellovibrionaceae bacterium]
MQFQKICGVFLFLTGCISSPQTDAPPLVSAEFSLQADRQAMDDLRSQVPAEKKVKNDEESFLLQFFTNADQPPEKIRERFQEAVRRKRKTFDDTINDQRKTFNRENQKSREDFQQLQKEKRESFSSKKNNSEQRQNFYGKLDTERREYNEDDRQKKDRFEDDIRTRRKDFEDYLRSKNADFDARYKVYVKEYQERVEAKKLKER